MGAKILYYIFLIPLSRMPFFFLYALSDFAFFVMYHLIGYRKKVVFQNLRKSFPEKSEKEIKQIGKQFFKHLCDLIVESIKGFTISEKEIKKRMKFKNNELLLPYFKEGRDAVMIGGHYNNWEYVAVGIGLSFDYQPLGIYKPLSNKFFDGKMRETRERYGLIMTPMKETLNKIQEDLGKPKAIIFGADQAPSNVRKSYWMMFLNQESPVFYGPEKIAKEYDLPVFYSTIHKIKRGHYEVVHQLVTDKPNETAYGEITKKHVRMLEEDIKLLPQYWLWSHKRWKRVRPDDMELHLD